jgi:hypothetical protein
VADIAVTPARTRTLRRALAAASGAGSVLDGFSADLPLGLTLRDVHFNVTAATAQDANITEIDSNLAISGPGVTVTRAG